MKATKPKHKVEIANPVPKLNHEPIIKITSPVDDLNILDSGNNSLSLDQDIEYILTDEKYVNTPEEGLVQTRKERIEAMLGERSELVSIIVLAYDRLEKTKICIECIQKYTNDIPYELILLDNGSSPETTDYFRMVQHPFKRIIRVTSNIGSIVPMSRIHWSGRYLVFITNDAYVTTNWLSNLLTCMKSDPSIGMVSPVVFNHLNNEIPQFTFKSLEEMQEKAAKHNISNPRLWHERILHEPLVGLFRSEALDIVGMFDYGFFHGFSDYDHSFRIRRAGYKTIICKDTYVHHDHLRNLKGDELEKWYSDGRAGKKDFSTKYFGIEAWEDSRNFEMSMVSMIKREEDPNNSEINVLGIDVACGSPILEIKNKLRESGYFNVNLSAFTSEAKYWLDLKTICSGNVVIDRIDYLKVSFPGRQFDYILLGKPINAYSGAMNLTNDLMKLLKPDGHLLLKLRNSFDVLAILKSLGATIRIQGDYEFPVYQMKLDQFLEQIKVEGYRLNQIALDNFPQDINLQNFMRNMISASKLNKDTEETYTRSLVREYILDITLNSVTN